MKNPGIEPPTNVELDKNSKLYGWLVKLQSAFARIRTYSQSLAPTSVAANTTNEQTFTVTGLTTEDIVHVNKPTHQAGLGITGYRVSAANTLAITFMNCTGSPITPTTETYLITAIRE